MITDGELNNEVPRGIAFIALAKTTSQEGSSGWKREKFPPPVPSLPVTFHVRRFAVDVSASLTASCGALGWVPLSIVSSPFAFEVNGWSCPQLLAADLSRPHMITQHVIKD